MRTSPPRRIGIGIGIEFEFEFEFEGVPMGNRLLSQFLREALKP